MRLVGSVARARDMKSGVGVWLVHRNLDCVDLLALAVYPPPVMARLQMARLWCAGLVRSLSLMVVIVVGLWMCAAAPAALWQRACHACCVHHVAWCCACAAAQSMRCVDQGPGVCVLLIIEPYVRCPKHAHHPCTCGDVLRKVLNQE